MTASENGHRYRLASTQLAITGLVIVVSGALIGALSGCHQPPATTSSAAAPVKVLPAPGGGMDTPIVIAGGSIHFKAKQSPSWTACTSGSMTCFSASFPQTGKKSTKNYQFFNDYDLNAIPVTSATGGWEIDVVDTNPDGKHMVRVCTETNSDYTACDTSSIHTDNIYVIAAGGGTFETPDSAHREKILYHDGVKKKYDKISNIVLNGAGNTCAESRCAVFLSK